MSDIELENLLTSIPFAMQNCKGYADTEIVDITQLQNDTALLQNDTALLQNLPLEIQAKEKSIAKAADALGRSTDVEMKLQLSEMQRKQLQHDISKVVLRSASVQ
jgi:lipopolysaccharide biosynthesis protein